jgi:predicted nuclease with TOPRIM domain
MNIFDGLTWQTALGIFGAVTTILTGYWAYRVRKREVQAKRFETHLQTQAQIRVSENAAAPGIISGLLDRMGKIEARHDELLKENTRLQVALEKLKDVAEENALYHAENRRLEGELMAARTEIEKLKNRVDHLEQEQRRSGQ